MSENEEVLVHLRGRLGKRARAAYDSRTDSPGQPTVSVATSQSAYRRCDPVVLGSQRGPLRAIRFQRR